jgi:hypothetical protein
VSLSFSEIKDLIGKPGVKLRMRGPFGIDVIEGELIGVLDQPSVILRCDDGIQHHFASEMAYELVKPPLPEEPPNGTVISNGVDAWIRCDDENGGDSNWYLTGNKQAWTWEEMQPGVLGLEWKHYVPDPVVSAPELPFREACGEIQANTPGYGMHNPVRIAIACDFYTADDAEQIGLAILRAAHEARAAS